MYRGEWFSGQKGPLGVRVNTHSGAKYEGSWTLGIQDGHGVELYADTSAPFPLPRTFEAQHSHAMREQ